MTGGRSRRFGWLRGVLTAVVAGVTLVSCAKIDETQRLAEPEVRDALPTQEYTDVELVHRQNGQVRFVMRAPVLNQYEKLNKAMLSGGIEVEIYQDGQRSSRLTAERGEVLNEGNTMRAIGNVVVTTDTGTTILTPRLQWERASGLITSDTTVTIVTELDTLHGTGLEATEDLKQRRILEPTGVSLRSVREEEQERQQTPSSTPEGPPPPPADTSAVDSAAFPADGLEDGSSVPDTLAGEDA